MPDTEIARLRIVTFPADQQEPEPCTGSYTCGCAQCVGDREEAVDRGVRYHNRANPLTVPRTRAA